MKVKNLLWMTCLSLLIFASCDNPENKSITKSDLKIRQLADTIGFTQYTWQLDTIISRIAEEDKKATDNVAKAVICPHDDYAYAGGLYQKTLSSIKAKTVVLIGVAHKARNFSLENKIVFGSFDVWKATDGNVPVSQFRAELMQKLNAETYMVHDSMMQVEHSLEAITPFLQRNNPEVEIIPILIPYFKFDLMEPYAEELALALADIMRENNMEYGKDLAIVISNDAIHYGDVDWSSTTMAPFGVDSIGTAQAHQKDRTIIKECLIGEVRIDKIKLFTWYTVQDDDYKAYKWTWCGRYALPFGLLTANALNNRIYQKNLEGTFIDYRSSFQNPHIEVEDIAMGHTAVAHQRHWVGYVGMTYQ